MIKFCFILAAVIALAAAAEPLSAQKTRVTAEQKAAFAAIFNNGYNQILIAKISPECRKRAFIQLAEAQNSTDLYSCDSWTDYSKDIGWIALAAVKSFSSLVEDLNTVYNVIPECTKSYTGVWHIFDIFACYLNNVKPIWDAIWDLFHYNKFYTDTADEVQKFAECIKRRNDQAKVKTENIVKMAKLC